MKEVLVPSGGLPSLLSKASCAFWAFFLGLYQFQGLLRQTPQRPVEQAFQLPDLFDVKADFSKDLLSGYGV